MDLTLIFITLKNENFFFNLFGYLKEQTINENSNYNYQNIFNIQMKIMMDCFGTCTYSESALLMYLSTN